MIDREVFPYFYEEPLPWSQKDSIFYLSYDEENCDSIKGDIILADKINRAYHNYGKISRSSKERETGHDKKIIEFIEEELHDRSFSEEITLVDVEEQRNLENARIKILNTERRKIYIKTRFCVSKAAPEKFIMDSPFEGHITSWYSECFNRMREANELIYEIGKSEEIGLDFLCNGITTQFYVDYPEMQGSNFDQYVKIHFPNMKSVKNASVFLDKYKEVFNLNLLCDGKGIIKRHTVITESAKALEIILNIYIHSTKKNIIVAKYEGEIATSKDIGVLNGMLNYGAANKEKLLENGNIGVIPISMSDINSYRRFTKILLKQMVSLDSERKTCPVCGEDMWKNRSSNNIAECRSCGFIIIDTECSECKEKYAFTRYSIPKTNVINADHSGFKVLINENKLAYKNITEAYIEENQMNPVCPCCGH